MSEIQSAWLAGTCTAAFIKLLSAPYQRKLAANRKPTHFALGAQDALPATQEAAAAAVAALKTAAAIAEAPAASATRIAELDRHAGELAAAFTREQSARWGLELCKRSLDSGEDVCQFRRTVAGSSGLAAALGRAECAMCGAG